MPLVGGVFQLQEHTGLRLGQLSQSRLAKRLLFLSSSAVPLPQTPLPRVNGEQEVTNQRPPQLGLCNTWIQDGLPSLPKDPSLPLPKCKDLRASARTVESILYSLSSQILQTLAGNGGRAMLNPG